MRRLIVLCLLLSLALSPSARGSYDPVGAGSTKLVLDRGFAHFLAENGISLSPAQGAKRRSTTFTLPVSGGNLDPTLGKGEIKAEGTLVFASARKRVPLRAITVKTKHSPLIAKVGGGQLKVASSSKLSFKREGFESSFSARALKLSAKVATRLNKKLRPSSHFYPGQLIGTLKAKAEPALTAILPQGKATLLPDPAFLAKLKPLFVSLNPIAPAELAPGPILYFPIAPGGQLAPDGSEGALRLAGAIELLQLGAGQVFQKEYWLDLGARDATAEVDIEPTPSFPGKLGRLDTYPIDLARATLSSEGSSRRISVQGAPLVLSAKTAQSFNEAFAEGKAAFVAGEPFGAVSFSAVGQ